MYIFTRIVETDGEMDVVLPTVMELQKVASDVAGLNVVAWSGGLGFRNGTLMFSVAYERVSDRAAATGKLAGSKAWADANRQLIPHIRSVEPDVLAQIIKGGSIGGQIPAGAVINSIQSRLAAGADWAACLQWAVEQAEINEKLCGVPGNVAYAVYGELGTINMYTGFPNAEAAEAARDAWVSSPEWMEHFLNGGAFAMEGSVLSRQLTKIN